MTIRRPAASMVLFVTLLAGGCMSQTSGALPRLEFVASDGCVDVFLFATNDEGSEFLLVDADVERLGLERGRPMSLRLDEAPPGLEVRLDVYAEPPISPAYCSDIISDEEPIGRWRAVAGRISITLRDREEGPSDGYVAPGIYRALAVLEALVLENETGQRVAADGPIEIAANVGWTPG